METISYPCLPAKPTTFEKLCQSQFSACPPSLLSLEIAAMRDYSGMGGELLIKKGKVLKG
jgi:hypothetical protein